MHLPLFTMEKERDSLIYSNLARTLLKVEKKDNHFRILYSVSSGVSFALHEAGSFDFSFRPAYVSLFAIQGWSENENIIPAKFSYFGMMKINCSE